MNDWAHTEYEAAVKELRPTWFDDAPRTEHEQTVLAKPLLECGYKLHEIAIRRRIDTCELIGVIIAKPRPAWLLACRLWLAGKGL
jgi:hypothetical protein